MYARSPTSVKTQFGRRTARIMLAMATVADPNEQLGPVAPMTPTEEHIELVEHYSAHNYHPLPIVVAEAEVRGSPTSRASVTSTCWRRTPPSTSAIATPR